MTGIEDIDFRDPITVFLADKAISVPMAQVMLFAVIMCFCLLLGRHKLGLLISYAFVFYWGFVFQRNYFIDLLGNTTSGMYLYAVSGVIMFFLALFAVFQKA